MPTRWIALANDTSYNGVALTWDLKDNITPLTVG
jgi:hypothetical protein